MGRLAFRTLLYRYFFFGWLFRDMREGDQYARALAWRHNVEQAHWLATYLRRWITLGTLLYGLGAGCEILLQSPLLSAFFFVPATLSISVSIIIGTLILSFKL